MRILVLLIFGLVGVANAQTPTVPSRMEFAGIKLRIHESGRKDIQESVDALTRSETHYNIMKEKARSYFPIIERIFREENLPEDFKFLVLQESALIPDAVSSSDAVGYWQFKDFTAMEMGLRVDKHIDERMNIVSATRAAANYLKKNNTYFDNWLHALQAYQMGAGGAMRVLDDASGVKSMTVDKKTYWYVKKFLAHKVAYEHVTSDEPQLKLSEYTNGSGKHLKEIAREVNITEEELIAYNKWLRRGRIPDDKAYTVIIPSEQYIGKRPDQRVIAKSYEKEDAPSASGTTIDYEFIDRDIFPKIEEEPDGFASINGKPGIIANAGDKVADLAARGGVSLSRFLKYNDIDIDHHVRDNEFFYLKKKRAKAGAYYHVLQYDQSLWDVSQKYAVRLKRLKAKNRIREEDPSLKPGRVLWLRYVRPSHVPIAFKEVTPPEKEKKEPVKDVEPATPVSFEEPETVSIVEKPDSVELKVFPLAQVEETEEVVNEEELQPAKDSLISVEEKKNTIDSVKRTHTVDPGETFYAISKMYNAKVTDLLDWNDMKINDKLAIGQKLTVYEYNIEEKKEAEKTEHVPFIFYTVQPGDTLYKIARSHEITVEELMELNDKSDFNLNLGDKIKVGRKIMSD